jgi:hypothetical protein
MKFANDSIADVKENDLNIVSMWTKIDPTRWVSGAFAGILAGVISLAVAMMICKIAGYELLYPVKLLAGWVMGTSATEYGMNVTPILVGGMLYAVLAVFWGMVYAHFTGTNSLSALLPMGLVWALFLWIFNWCLFGQSIRTVYWAGIPAGVIMPVCLAYGLSLSSVAFFDRTLRG